MISEFRVGGLRFDRRFGEDVPDAVVVASTRRLRITGCAVRRGGSSRGSLTWRRIPTGFARPTNRRSWWIVVRSAGPSNWRPPASRTLRWGSRIRTCCRVFSSATNSAPMRSLWLETASIPISRWPIMPGLWVFWFFRARRRLMWRNQASRPPELIVEHVGNSGRIACRGPNQRLKRGLFSDFVSGRLWTAADRNKSRVGVCCGIQPATPERIKSLRRG